MRWALIIVLALASAAAAQQPALRPPPPPGVDISARDGDRIIVDDDARIQIVRRRQATLRTIYSQTEQLLIVLVDYSKPGEFPDGQVDLAFNFYQVDGAWPLGPRWEGLTAMYQYEGDRPSPRGLAFETPQGLVKLLPNGRDLPKPDASLLAVLTFRGSSGSPRRRVSFAEAETIQLHDFSRSKASAATVSTLTGPDGSRGTAILSGGVRGPNDAPRPVRGGAPPSIAVPRQVRTSPPPSQQIAANDGDRVLVEDDARVQIVRRRQVTVRTIFNQEQRALIVLADYGKPGEFPDGTVDTTFNFYELEGEWPLPPRWEALTTMFHYEGDPEFPTRYGLATPQGLVHLSAGRPGLRKPDPTAIADLWYGASTIGQGHTLSFEEAEERQLAEAAKHRSAPGYQKH